MPDRSNVAKPALVLVLMSASALAVPAFPGASGAGAASVGGRGGTVFRVTTLADSGPGSLRACVEASGPRTCVFTLGGTITLNTGFWITNPFLTVAGQTAPGGGITLTSAPSATISNLVGIVTHDVIWQYVRLRNRYHVACSDSGASECGANLSLMTGAVNVIVDHVSTSWNQDEGFGVWGGGTGALSNVTFSNNLVAEGLDSHSTGLITGGNTSAEAAQVANIDLHHNVFMNNSHRNPLLKGRSARVVNNLFYNNSFYENQCGGGGSVDLIGNVYKRGPLGGSSHEIQAFSASGTDAFDGQPSLFVQGNVGWNQPVATADQWLLTQRVTGENGTENGALPATWRRTTPLPATTYPIVVDAAAVIGANGGLIEQVGVFRRLDCAGAWVPNRDAVDARLVTQYQTNTGISTLLPNETAGGGLPALASGTACADVDTDGLPDVWESARFGTLAQGPSADPDGNGYSNLEEYLHGIAAPTTGCAMPSGVQATSSASSVLAGASVTASASGGTGGTMSWSVTPTTGVSQASGTGNTTGALTFSMPGSYVVRFTSTNATTPSGCSPSTTASASVQVTVTPRTCTAPSAISVAADTTTPLALGGTNSFVATGGTPGQLTWAVTPSTGVTPSSGTGAIAGPIRFASAGLFTIEFTSSNASPSGCMPVSVVRATRRQVVEVPSCAVPSSLGLASAPQTVALGTPTTLSVTGGTPGTVRWTVAPAASVSPSSGSGATAGPLTFTAEGTFVVHFESTNDLVPAGCSSTASVSMDVPVDVTRAACSSPSTLTPSPASATLARGAVLSLSVGGGQPAALSWSITPREGVSSSEGFGADTGPIAFSRAGVYEVVFRAMNDTVPSGCGTRAEASAMAVVTVVEPDAGVSSDAGSSEFDGGTGVEGHATAACGCSGAGWPSLAALVAFLIRRRFSFNPQRT